MQDYLGSARTCNDNPTGCSNESCSEQYHAHKRTAPMCYVLVVGNPTMSIVLATSNLCRLLCKHGFQNVPWRCDRSTRLPDANAGQNHDPSDETVVEIPQDTSIKSLGDIDRSTLSRTSPTVLIDLDDCSAVEWNSF